MKLLNITYCNLKFPIHFFINLCTLTLIHVDTLVKYLLSLYPCWHMSSIIYPHANPHCHTCQVSAILALILVDTIVKYLLSSLYSLLTQLLSVCYPHSNFCWHTWLVSGIHTIMLIGTDVTCLSSLEFPVDKLATICYPYSNPFNLKL